GPGGRRAPARPPRGAGARTARPRRSGSPQAAGYARVCETARELTRRLVPAERTARRVYGR
ncbi:hypothetical protein, partial [Streptomyces sp. NPDC003668]